MFDTAGTAPLTGVDTAVDSLLAVTAALDPAALDAAAPRELIAALEQLQQIANLVSAVEQTVLAHAIVADSFETHGYTSPSELLVDRCRVDRSEAHARVTRARRAEPRTTLTGEVLPPKLELLAAAQAVGDVSGEHVDRVVTWMVKIERKATLEQCADAERRLVAEARASSPQAVAALGREILHDLDPDGPEPRDLERRRGLTLKQNDDGSGTLTGTLLPEVLAKLETLLSPLAAPNPLNPQTGERDPRGSRQRLHDALEELADRLLQSGDMPAHGGIPLTLIVMMDLDDLLAKTGTARTAFGTTIPVARSLEQAAEMQIVPVITSKVDGVLAYGMNRRIASPGQALALAARDRGCTFPGCPTPQANETALPVSTPSRPRSRRRPRRNRPRQPRPGLRSSSPPLRPLGVERRTQGRQSLVGPTDHRRPRPTTHAQPRAPRRRLTAAPCNKRPPPAEPEQPHHAARATGVPAVHGNGWRAPVMMNGMTGQERAACT